MTLLEPILIGIIQELGKAGAPHSFAFGGDLANDLATKARSFSQLVRGGMPLAEATAVSGLLVQED